MKRRFFSHSNRHALAGGLAVSLLLPAAASAAQIMVTLENIAPANGTYLTPMWVGFHNGSFDLFNSGAAASAGLERIAEDGATGPLSTEFTAAGFGTVQGMLGGGPIAPGQTVSFTFMLDGLSAMSRYFSYASMIIPSNDAFVGNGNPLFRELFDGAGNFIGGGSVIISGAMVYDAGTEVNDEVPANTAFFGQMAPNTGVTENGVVGIHPGFNAPGSGGILDSAQFANADFKAANYQVARLTFTEVPEPASLALLGLAGVSGLWLRRRRA